jgi:hypothetical protein
MQNRGREKKELRKEDIKQCTNKKTERHKGRNKEIERQRRIQ